MTDHAYSVTVCAARHCGEPITGHPTNADLAVIARIGGRMMTAHRYVREWTAETLSLAAQVVAQGIDRPAMLPEAAFDWPIYRAATDDQRDNNLRWRAAEAHLSGWLAQIMAAPMPADVESGIEQYQRESR